MLVESLYNFGDILYLKTDEEQKPRMLTSMIIMPLSILYELSCGTQTTKHYEVEFSKEVNTEIKYK